MEAWSSDMSWKLGRASCQPSTSSSSARIVRQDASKRGIQSKVEVGRNGVVGTSDDLTTNRSRPCSSRAPTWLATSTALSRAVPPPTTPPPPATPEPPPATPDAPPKTLEPPPATPDPPPRTPPPATPEPPPKTLKPRPVGPGSAPAGTVGVVMARPGY